jgi:hypothetical protein
MKLGLVTASPVSFCCGKFCQVLRRGAAMKGAFCESNKVALPAFSGVRVLMMPIVLEDIRHSLPEAIRQWADVIEAMKESGKQSSGVAYLTIDERIVPEGYCHRRPGLHVDGWTDDGGGAWGGGGMWGKRGFAVVASREGCAAYDQDFYGQPKQYGDCDHLRHECKDNCREVLAANRIYCLSQLAVHESIPQRNPGPRQFARLSFPSGAGWFQSCTPNPLGVLPTGPILPARPQSFTNYEPMVQP